MNLKDLHDDLQRSNIPDFKGLLLLAKERNYTDDKLAACIEFLFKTHSNRVLSSLSSTVHYQQMVINTLVDVEDKDRFIGYINQCIEHGMPPHSVSIADWKGFLDFFEGIEYLSN